VLGQMLGDLRLTMRRELPGQVDAHLVVEAREMALEVRAAACR
jgi:hypothetical protein